MPAESPALHFVRDVVVHIKESWQEYTIPADRHDNVLAMLSLLHMHVRCVIKPNGGDEDNVEEEVSPAGVSVVSVFSETEH